MLVPFSIGHPPVYHSYSSHPSLQPQTDIGRSNDTGWELTVCTLHTHTPHPHTPQKHHLRITPPIHHPHYTSTQWHPHTTHQLHNTPPTHTTHITYPYGDTHTYTSPTHPHKLTGCAFTSRPCVQGVLVRALLCPVVSLADTALHHSLARWCQLLQCVVILALLVQTLQSTREQQLKYSWHKHQIQKTRYRGVVEEKRCVLRQWR